MPRSSPTSPAAASASTPAAAPLAGAEVSFAEPASYELAVAELDRLIAHMEGGQVPLDQLLGSYRRGSELLAWCRQRLQVVEEQVKVLEDGQLKAWPGA